MTMGSGGPGLSAPHFFVHVVYRLPVSPGGAGEDRDGDGGNLHKDRLRVNLIRSYLSGGMNSSKSDMSHSRTVQIRARTSISRRDILLLQ